LSIMFSPETSDPVVTGPNMDSLGFQAMDSNIPVMPDYLTFTDFGIRTYFDMFKKMEDTFKFCVECKKLPDALPDSKNLRRCKRCQNVYYCSPECQRANWPVHKKFCKKLKLVALDRLVEWLIFTGRKFGFALHAPEDWC
uniref:MSS51 mitochondrial translational activator n=1 Tax=Crocodylus porosus TaxID=8502 RepID=A0A7M4DUJ0_CROPO